MIIFLVTSVNICKNVLYKNIACYYVICACLLYKLTENVYLHILGQMSIDAYYGHLVADLNKKSKF